MNDGTLFWNNFAQTGGLEAYLAYRAMREMFGDEEDEHI